jgi:HTH-like domain
VSYVEVQYEMSERHACRLVGLARSTNRYRARKAARDAARLKELAAKRMRFGYRRLTEMLIREGMAANHKRVASSGSRNLGARDQAFFSKFEIRFRDHLQTRLAD